MNPFHPRAGFCALRLLSHAEIMTGATIDVITTPQRTIQKHVLDLTPLGISGLKPDPLLSIGITPSMPNIPLVIGKIADDSPASLAGFQLNDKIIAINNLSIKTWNEIVTFIMEHPDEKLTFTLERNKKIIQLPVVIGHQRDIFFTKTGYLGIGPDFKLPKDMLRTVKYSPLAAIAPAYQELSDFTYFNILLIGKLITGKLSLQSLGGPITIFDTAGDALNIGLVSFLGFLAFLSVSIGVINFLPLPGLDGGHLFIQIIECIIRRPLPEKMMSILYRISFMLILFILMIALVNDLLRLY